MLCHTADAPFSSDDWVFELKYDGFRLAAFGGAGRAELRYRSGQDPTLRYPELTSALRALPIPGLVLDGEIVMLDAEGKPDFHRLAARAQIHRASEIQRAALATPVTYMVFDLLGAAGFDLRGLPLLVRKACSRGSCRRSGRSSSPSTSRRRARRCSPRSSTRGLEGVVAKRADSPYRPDPIARLAQAQARARGRLRGVRLHARRSGSRAGLGALHLCVRRDGAWRWAGKVGSGLDDQLLNQLRAELDARPAWQPTFPRPEGTADVRWVEPELVVQVRYGEWPEGSPLRFPVFMRLRRDKAAAECTAAPRRAGGAAHDGDGEREEPPKAPPVEVEIDQPVRELRLSNLQKVFWKAEGITKGELIDYYRAIAPHILPYLANRPTVLTRYPDGIDGEMFYQKDMPDWVPPWLRTTTRWSEHSQREIHYVLIDDADGLAFVANLGSIPIHAWASRIIDLEQPDWTILDLDPKNAPREHVVPLALAIHELCDAAGLPSYVKTSGQSGLHVLIPLGGQCTFEQARMLAYLIGQLVERRHPDMATTARNPAARGGRVYLDWGQNAHGQLLVVPYSVRPVAGAPVSMPLVWDEVVPGLDPKQFHIRNALDRVTAWPGDPCLPVLTERPDLGAALARLEQITQAG